MNGSNVKFNRPFVHVYNSKSLTPQPNTGNLTRLLPTSTTLLRTLPYTAVSLRIIDFGPLNDLRYSKRRFLLFSRRRTSFGAAPAKDKKSLSCAASQALNSDAMDADEASYGERIMKMTGCGDDFRSPFTPQHHSIVQYSYNQRRLIEQYSTVYCSRVTRK